jgi:hypothetical protein
LHAGASAWDQPTGSRNDGGGGSSIHGTQANCRAGDDTVIDVVDGAQVNDSGVICKQKKKA